MLFGKGVNISSSFSDVLIFETLIKICWRHSYLKIPVKLTFMSLWNLNECSIKLLMGNTNAIDGWSPPICPNIYVNCLWTGLSCKLPIWPNINIKWDQWGPKPWFATFSLIGFGQNRTTILSNHSTIYMTWKSQDFKIWRSEHWRSWMHDGLKIWRSGMQIRTKR